MMNKMITSVRKVMVILGIGIAAGCMTACNPEPDESDLYTLTGETIESYLSKHESFSDFNYILSRVGYNKLLASYGTYTCFAPSNAGVEAYCDSLYDDTECTIAHNGMTARSVEGLSDSLCLNIAKYHLTSSEKTAVDLTGSGEISTLLGFEITYGSKGKSIILNEKAIIDTTDVKVTNGIIQCVNQVIPRYTRMIDDMLKRDDAYSIFSKAFEITGMADSVQQYTRGSFTFVQRSRENYTGVLASENECKVGFTVFAEPDSVLKQNGINSFEDLVAYANKAYSGSSSWYNYVSENSLSVSTGTDYTSRSNALNMFVAYHILKASMSANQLVFEKGSSTYWNYAADADPQDYYETLLPHTIMKIWEPHNVGNGKHLFINRYQTFNTLTNEVGTQGTNHELIDAGVEILRTGSLTAYNGYVHPINSMLVYSQNVAKGTLNERMRFNCTTLFPELITNRMRYHSGGDGYIGSGYDNSRIGIPTHYFENAKIYNENICFAYAMHGAWRCYESDQLQFWGVYDFSFKIPPVPTGTYEVRIVYPPLSYGSFMQYYFGYSNNQQSMEALGIPHDITIEATDPRIGWTDCTTEDDKGIATDVAMHNRGYMRGPYSFCGHGENGWSTTNNCRVEQGYGTMIIRAVLGRVNIKQGKENWLRIKTLQPDNSNSISGIDFIELVPVGVVDNQQYSEDWY
jgi:uncharacterized surface protein with fasciclin (FAS1) repeats